LMVAADRPTKKTNFSQIALRISRLNSASILSGGRPQARPKARAERRPSYSPNTSFCRVPVMADYARSSDRRRHVAEPLESAYRRGRAAARRSSAERQDCCCRSDNCRNSVVKSVAEHLIAVRGVNHGKLMLTSTGKDLPE
jgi:hypothetical protein